MSGAGPARYLLLNYMKVDAANVDTVAATVRLPRPTDARFSRAVYRHEAGDRLMEFVALPDLSGLEELLTHSAWREVEDAVRPRLALDHRRQIHALCDVAKPSASAVPDAAHVQLIRAEVPPHALAEYRAWRRDVLLPALSALPGVTACAAYQSVVSTEPGALLVTQSRTSPAQLTEAQQATAPKEALRHAASHFTLGAVHTSHWERL
ncbi:hypothetical protein JGU66_06620 [Myxococcaceae bacterium JPH2]|nr:hypothetical protein [Myxococcaceae bacterium JPH2]